MNHLLPFNYRTEIIQKLLAVIRVGESCSIISIGSCGKSDLARHLIRQDVIDYYQATSRTSTIFVMLNCVRIMQNSIGVLHTLILEALFEAMRNRADCSATKLYVKLCWERACSLDSNDHHVWASVVDAFRYVFTYQFQQIVILMDGADDFIVQAPSATLKSLRALRDIFRLQLNFVVLTRRELAFLRNQNEYHDFYELVARETFAMGPFNISDATCAATHFISRFGLNDRVGSVEIPKLLNLSGRHAGLMRAIIQTLQHNPTLSLSHANAISIFGVSNFVELECEQIWLSLEPKEQNTLYDCAVVKDSPSTNLRSIEKKGLIRLSSGGNYQIFSPLFHYYVTHAVVNN